MGWIIPYFNRDVSEMKALWHEKVTDEKTQKKMVLIIVSIALLLDNMLYMVIVPIVPKFLEDKGAYTVEYHCKVNFPDDEIVDFTINNPVYKDYQHLIDNKTICYRDNAEEDEKLGYLFASKAVLQLIVNPFSGTLIDRIGYEVPMVFGLSVMFVSTMIFAVGNSYGVLFFARSIQGLGSAFADTAGLAMIADRFCEDHERSKALGIAIAFISFGSLIAPPFGGFLYQTMGKPVPFLILAMICLMDAIMVFLVIHPKIRKTETGERLKGTPIWRLLLDPYIAICAGALVMANVSLAFLEPTIGKWMESKMDANQIQQGVIWFPAFFPHLGGVYFTIYMMGKYPQYPWAIALLGLSLEGVSCLLLPFCEQFFFAIVPLSILCFGIALMDTAILPLLAYLVDTRHVSVYGSIYAIADISYSTAYAIGPIIAGQVVANYSFKALNVGICVSNLLYLPFIYKIKSVYNYQPMEQELNEIEGGGGSGEKSYGALELNSSGENGQGPNHPGGPTGGTVEYKDTLYNRKVKKKNMYRGFKDTDAIIGDDELDPGEEEEENAGGPGTGGGYQSSPYAGHEQGGMYGGANSGW